MKSRSLVIVGSLALFVGAGIWVGCGGDDTTTPGVDAGNDTSTNPDTGGQKDTGTDGTTTDGSTTDGSTDGSTTDGAIALPQNCTAYCTLVQTACPTNSANGQYLDQATCEKMCAKFPNADAGAGDGSVQTGPSFACHAYHATVAAQSSQNAAIHCPHAGPYGFGGCGSETENFCLMFNAQCTGGGGYGGNCANSFGQVNDTTDGGSFLPGTGPRDCREYHLQNAYQGNITTGSHCDHASKNGGGVCQ
jgi:hypothetical protein